MNMIHSFVSYKLNVHSKLRDNYYFTNIPQMNSILLTAYTKNNQQTFRLNQNV